MSTKFFKIISVGTLALALAIFTGGVARAITTVNANAVTNDGALTITGAAASTWSLSAGALTVNSGATAALTLDSGTTGAVNLGTGASAKTITIGNNTTSTGIVFTSGTGGIDITSTAAIADVLDISAASLTTADLFDIDAAAITTGDFFDITVPTTRTSGTAVLITDNSVAASVTAPLLDVNVEGTTDTNTLDITFATLIATGNAIDLNMGTNVAGDAINIGGAATTGDGTEIVPGTARTSGSALLITDASIAATVTGDLIQIDVTGTPDTNTIDIDVSGIATATSNALDITYATVAALGNAIDLNMGTNVAGDALNIGGAATTGDSIQIVPGTARTSGAAILITDDSLAAAVTGSLVDINVEGTTDTNTLDITFATLIATGNAIDLNMGTNVAGDAINIGGSATTGDGIEIVPGTARTSGSALLITDASIAATVTGDLIQIDVTGTPDTNTIDIDVSGIATATSNALDITYATVAALGNAIDLNMGTNVAGDALNIGGAATTGDSIQIVPGTARTSGAAILITDDSLAAAVTGSLVDINVEGTTDTNTLDITFATLIATGNAIDLNMGTNVAGDAINIGGSATTGDGIEIVPGTARTSGSALLITDASIAATV